MKLEVYYLYSILCFDEHSLKKHILMHVEHKMM